MRYLIPNQEKIADDASNHRGKRSQHRISGVRRRRGRVH